MTTVRESDSLSLNLVDTQVRVAPYSIIYFISIIIINSRVCHI